MEEIMENLKEDFARLIGFKWEIGSFHWVHVTHIVNPNSFYVRSTCFYEFCDKFEGLQPLHKVTSVDPLDVVVINLGKPQSAMIFVRGRVLRIVHENGSSDLKFDILAIDYGIIEKAVLIQDIWVCEQKYASIPAQAEHCQLANCGPEGRGPWPQSSTEVFKFFLGDERTRMHVMDNSSDRLSVEMYNSCPNDIATMLLLTGHSTLDNFRNAVSYTSIKSQDTPTLKFKQLKVDEIVKVRMLHGDSLNAFYVAEIDEYKKHLNDCNDLKFYLKIRHRLQGQYIKRGALVSARNDTTDNYDRGVIKQVLPDSYSVIMQLVDSGKEQEVHIGLLKKLPDYSLRDIPAVAIYCSAEQSDKWKNDDLRPGYEFLIKICKLGNKLEKPHIVELIQ